jgi:hypothetical protein
MAASAVLRLIRQYQVDPRNVGFLALVTESSTDNAAGAVIVRGMVDRALDELRTSGSPARPSRDDGRRSTAMAERNEAPWRGPAARGISRRRTTVSAR